MEYLGLNLTTKEIRFLNEELNKYKYNKKHFSYRQPGYLMDGQQHDRWRGTEVHATNHYG